MAHYKLSDVVVEINERENNPSCSKYERFVGLEHYVSGEVIIRNYGSTELLASSMKIFKNGDILVARRNVYLKRASMVDFDGLTSGDSIVLRAKNPVIGRVLPFVLNTEEFWDFADQYSDGTMSKRLSPKTLMTYEFDLPEENELEYFGNLLWAANDTKESYQQLLVQTDELVKSQFIEMFGSIKESITLGECSTLHARVGWQALKKDEHQLSGDYMLITGTDFKDGKVDYSTCVYVSKERYGMDPHIQVKNGDILITKDGTIGKVAIVEDLPKPATLNAGVFVVRPDGRFDVDFFSYLFSGPIFADFVEVVKTGSTIKHLNQGKLIKYSIPVASMEQQRKFAEIYKQSDKSKCCEQRYSRYCLRGGELCA